MGLRNGCDLAINCINRRSLAAASNGDFWKDQRRRHVKCKNATLEQLANLSISLNNIRLSLSIGHHLGASEEFRNRRRWQRQFFKAGMKPRHNALVAASFYEFADNIGIDYNHGSAGESFLLNSSVSSQASFSPGFSGGKLSMRSRIASNLRRSASRS